jgi:hypothetical protein
MMTKAQALALFREEILPAVHARYGRYDRVAVREAWNDYTDGLCKDRQITRYQDQTWTNPFP